MLSADNLNIDVLEEIFSYLPHGPNLASIALVSRSFLEAVVPRLYATICFRLRHAKSYPEVLTPFGAIIAHRDLATYVRHVEIFAIPQTPKASRLINHPWFIRECTEALKLCYNLNSFTTTVPEAVTYFFPSIIDKPRLEKLHITANLTTAQSQILLGFKSIRRLELQCGSWSVADILPKWVQGSLHKSLKHLTLYMINNLNEEVLEAALKQLPDLRGLHVIGCTKADHNCVLRVAQHTPLLEHLSMTTSEANKLISLPSSELGYIQSLALDSRTPDTDNIISAIFQYLRATYIPLTSFKLRVAVKKDSLPLNFIRSLVEVHGHSLRRLAFLDCDVTAKMIEHICKNCPKLERVNFTLPKKELGALGRALSHAKNLRAIVDHDNHAQHGPRLYLTSDNVEFLMNCAPCLTTIIEGNRVWTRQRSQHDFLSVRLERRPTRKAGTYWFMPQEA